VTWDRITDRVNSHRATAKTAPATRAQFCGIALLTLLGACSADSSGSSTAPGSITVTAGDAQLADVRDLLPAPLRFVVTDRKGRPVPDVPVTLVVTLGDGSVPLSQLTTNADGMVETSWTMGTMGGVQELQARVNSGLVASATATTCVPGDCYPESRLDGPLSDATLFALATYDSSGQTVHPDIAHGYGAASGFWLAITPYPGGDLTHENPSIFRSNDTEQWAVPTGVTNPLVVPSAITGYQSDPDIVFNPSDQRLWMYFRSYSTTTNTISVIHSSNGSNWDAPTVLFSTPAHQVVSPSIVRSGPAAPWEMWSVNSGPQGCTATSTTVERRTSTDGLNWGGAATTDLVQPGQVIWHIDVEWVPGRAEYWAVYNTFVSGENCATHALYLARSTDGVHWITSPSPIARSGLVDAFADVIYRSSFLPDTKGNRILMVMSGAKYLTGIGYVWRTASVSTSAATLLAIAAAPSAPLSRMSYRTLPPPEGDVGH
jgi:hypothetical protein